MIKGNPVKPLHVVKVGATITPKRRLTNNIVKQFMYSNECADVGGGLVENTAILEIIEKSPFSNGSTSWVKVAIPGSYPKKVLKLSGEEYFTKFWCAD